MTWQLYAFGTLTWGTKRRRGAGSSRLCLQPSASVSLKQEHLQRKAWPQERQGALALADLNSAASTSLEDVQQSKGGLFKKDKTA